MDSHNEAVSGDDEHEVEFKKNKDGKYECVYENCDKIPTAKLYNIQTHFRNVHLKQKEKCQYCKKEFIRQYMKNHEKLCNPEEKKEPHKCRKCKKEFKHE